MSSRWHRLRVRTGIACALASVSVALLPGTFGSVRASADSGSGSPLTVSGTGAFASLKVTVSQTQSLIDQVVKVSWTGGAPTVPDGGSKADYLQIMQCWGDDPSGPDRTQCEYGALTGNVQGLDSTQTTREVFAGAGVVDPLETLLPTPDNPDAEVPFAPVHPNTDPGADNSAGEYFNSLTTNEVPLARTESDGTGETYFEAQTTEEAPGLGCGERLTDSAGAVTGRQCWLVVVPRGETEVNGAPYTDQAGGLVSSPLSATNWSHRIVVPLQFLPVGLDCPLGGNEQRTVGQEMAEEAVLRWQPTLCTQTGTAYGYTSLSDDSARARLLSASPGLEFVGAPVAAGQVPAGKQLAYAPIAISGGVIAFDLDTTTFTSSPAELRARNGLRVPDINLTQRLVAKLITQSYQSGAPAFDPAVSRNPTSITSDPDFLAVNPGLTGLTASLGDVLMPFGSSDVIQELWTWIDADPDAKAFLDGTPDPWGMVVNPAYRGITDAGAINDFPKNDNYCTTQNVVPGQPPPCTLDDRPYADDMHAGARAAARGDSLNKSFWDLSATPPSYKKVAAQLTGQRHVMAFTDAATAIRYSLPVAHLRNAGGSFVTPTAAAMAAGVADMTPTDVPGVLAPNPTTVDPAAYPLTSVTYAATNPAVLSAASRTAFAAFLRYAATTGQEPGLDSGQLPFGYLPLTDAMSWQTLQVATALFAPAVSTSAPAPSATPTMTPSRTPTQKPTPKPAKTKATKPPTSRSPSPSVSATTTPTTVLPTQQPPVALPPAPVQTPASVSVPAATTSPLRTPPPDPTSAAAPPTTTAAAAQPSATERVVSIPLVRTARVQAGAGRYLMVIVLAFGAVCALSGPLLLRFAHRPSQGSKGPESSR